MFRPITMALLSLSVTACSSTPETEMDAETKESVYLQTENYSELAYMYEEQLEEQDTVETRLKLSETYLKLEDSENALFYVEPVFEKEPTNCWAHYYKAEAILMTGDFATAKESALKADSLCPDYPETENILGIIYAAQYNYHKARESFNAARKHYYDTVTITNNLAVLDIAEGRYHSALQRLIPVYRQAPNDSRLKSNLILAAAKENQFELVQQILEGDYTDSEIEAIYQTLHDYEPRYQSDVGHFVGKENE